MEFENKLRFYTAYVDKKDQKKSKINYGIVLSFFKQIDGKNPTDVYLSVRRDGNELELHDLWFLSDTYAVCAQNVLGDNQAMVAYRLKNSVISVQAEFTNYEDYENAKPDSQLSVTVMTACGKGFSLGASGWFCKFLKDTLDRFLLPRVAD
jgi:hypothetical protein